MPCFAAAFFAASSRLVVCFTFLIPCSVQLHKLMYKPILASSITRQRNLSVRCSQTYLRMLCLGVRRNRGHHDDGRNDRGDSTKGSGKLNRTAGDDSSDGSTYRDADVIEGHRHSKRPASPGRIGTPLPQGEQSNVERTVEETV